MSLSLFSQISNGQQLTIEETFEYIEKIENKYQGYISDGSKVTVKYNVDEDGVFKKETIFTKEGSSKIVEKISVHVNDLKKEFKYDGNNFIRFECLNRNCFYVEEDGIKFVDKKDRKSFKNEGLSVYIEQEYNAKKIIKALNYLFSKLDEKDFNRDENDPFADDENEVTIFKSEKSDEIPLYEKNGTYRVKVYFGKINEWFIVDSGAAEISISSSFAKKLIENKKILKSDLLTDGLYRIANGKVISQKRINIRTLKVGNFTVKNVRASVGNSNSPLLLGRSFFDKFNNWSINNKLKKLKLSK